MIGLPRNVRVWRSVEALPTALIEDLEEFELVKKVSGYDDTMSVVVADAENNLLAYAVVGPDEDGITTIYAARCLFGGAGAMMLKAIFGASQVLGAPMRVHTDRIHAFQRAIGADVAVECEDAEGLPMGVFHG